MIPWIISRKIITIQLLVAMISISGCVVVDDASNDPNRPTITNSAIATGGPTSAVPAEVLKTPSPVQEKPTETAIQTVSPPTSTWVPGTTQACFPIMPETSMQDLSLQGAIVLAPELFTLLEFINLESGEKQELAPMLSEDGRFLSFDLSPDHSSLAIQEVRENEESRLWITNSRGEIINDMDFDLDWSNFRWVNDEQIEVHYKGEGDQWPFSAIFIDPGTGELEHVPAVFPGIHFTNLPDHTPGWTIVYSPDKELVVYLRNEESGFWNEAVLWDRAQDKPLWQRTGTFALHSSDPTWSPDGEQLAIIFDLSLHRITRAGMEIPLPLSRDEMQVQDYSWSPNGSMLAFWAFVLDENQNRLFLLDTGTNKIIDTCLTIYPSGAEPEWSPDSKWMIVRAQIVGEDGSKNTVTVLIDLVQEAGYQLPEAERPLFWMSSLAFR